MKAGFFACSRLPTWVVLGGVTLSIMVLIISALQIWQGREDAIMTGQ